MIQSKKTTIWFKDSERNKINLTIRLTQDRLTATDFFRACVKSFLEKDEDFMEFYERIQQEHLKTLGPEELERRRKQEEEEKNVRADFSVDLDDIDVENIFDILGSKHPYL